METELLLVERHIGQECCHQVYFAVERNIATDYTNDKQQYKTDRDLNISNGISPKITSALSAVSM